MNKTRQPDLVDLSDIGNLQQSQQLDDSQLIQIKQSHGKRDIRSKTHMPNQNKQMELISKKQQFQKQNTMYQEQSNNTNLNKYLNYGQKLMQTEEDLYKRNQQKMRKIRQQKQTEFINRVNFFDGDIQNVENRKYYYPSDIGFSPFLYFYKYLARKPDNEEQNQTVLGRLKLWIPDTIIVHDGELPEMWMYSSEEGYVYRADNFNYKNVVAKMGRGHKEEDLVCVVKKQGFIQGELAGNDISLVTKKDLNTRVGNIFNTKEGITVIQTFIKSKGPKPFICRVCWRKEKNSYAFIITQKYGYSSQETKIQEIQKFITTQRNPGTCTIVETNRGIFLDQTLPYVKNLMSYFKLHLNITFKEFIADFTKDDHDNWWFLNCKGFQLEDNIPTINTKLITMYGEYTIMQQIQDMKLKGNKQHDYRKVRACKYCEIVFPEQELQYQMTLREIFQNDAHLLHRSQQLKWLKRIEPKHLDSVQLFKKHKVCISCFQLHVEIQKLIQLELEFAKKTGIQTNPFQKYNTVSFIDLKGNKQNVPKKSKINEIHDNPNSRVPMPENWELQIEPNTEIQIDSNLPKNQYQQTISELSMYRFMILIHQVRDIPFNPLEEDNELLKNNFYIQYEFLGITEKYKIDFFNLSLQNQKEETYQLDLNRLRLFYFFSENRENVNEFLKEKQFIDIFLYKNKEKLGVLQIDLTEFLNPIVLKVEEYKIFSGIYLPTLKWGVTMTAGLVNSGTQDISRIKLNYYQKIQIPSSEFYSCKPLPEEWMIVLNEKEDYKKPKNLSFMTNTFSNQQLTEYNNNIASQKSFYSNIRSNKDQSRNSRSPKHLKQNQIQLQQRNIRSFTSQPLQEVNQDTHYKHIQENNNLVQKLKNNGIYDTSFQENFYQTPGQPSHQKYSNQHIVSYSKSKSNKNTYHKTQNQQNLQQSEVLSELSPFKVGQKNSQKTEIHQKAIQLHNLEDFMGQSPNDNQVNFPDHGKIHNFEHDFQDFNEEISQISDLQPKVQESKLDTKQSKISNNNMLLKNILGKELKSYSMGKKRTDYKENDKQKHIKKKVYF